MQASPEYLSTLIAASGEGDQVAFAELYRLTSARLYGIAMRLLRNRDSANEALQEAYVRIWSQAGRFEAERGQVVHWMGSILRHICLDQIRATAARPVADVDMDELELAVAPHDGDALDVDRCMKVLDRTQARAIRLTIHFGMSHSELAEKLNIPLGTIKSTVRRGLLRLKECLDRDNAS